MSDPLVERLAQAAADATGEPENCDTAVLQDRRNRWEEAYVINWDAVAEAARAFIADEIHECRGAISSPSGRSAYVDAGMLRGLDKAESIAQGDTE